MLDIAKDIQSLTAFRRRSGDFMKQLKRSKRPLVAHGEGEGGGRRAGRGSLSALARQRRRLRCTGGHPPGLEDAKKGRMRPVRKFFDDFEARHGVPR